MIVRCPQCSTSFRVREEIVSPSEVKFRCSRCQLVFIPGPEGPQEDTKTGGPSETAGTPAVTSVPSAENLPAPRDPAKQEETTPPPAEQSSRAENPFRKTGEPKEGHSEKQENVVGTLDEDFFIFPKNESSSPSSRVGGQISIIPYVSLLGILLFVFSIITLTYQVNPQPLNSFIRRLPWYGALIFANSQFPEGLEFESLSSGFQTVRGNREVFIVSGKMSNRSERGVQDVRIEASIYNIEGNKIDQKTISMGNPFSPKIIRDMTEREIFLLQSLDPQNAFTIPPSESVDFTIVFPKPDENITTFSCRLVAAAVVTS